uniref:RNA-binding protein 33 n=1 Tax=Sphaerodactylus townsendi TaxID=933632 RepID=A0ACB8FW13_9SAUR
MSVQTSKELIAAIKLLKEFASFRKDYMDKYSIVVVNRNLCSEGGENVGLSHPEGAPYRLQQPLEQRHQPVRKVTLTKGTIQQPHQPHPHQLAQIHSAVPQGLKNIQRIHQAKKVIMHGRGRGIAGLMGRGRLMPNKQNLRVVECKPQPCVVSVEGLSSSTTDVQLKNLLMSVGPVQVDHPVLFVTRARNLSSYKAHYLLGKAFGIAGRGL